MIKSRKILDSWYKTFFYGGWTTENGTVRLNKEYETIDRDLEQLEKFATVVNTLKCKNYITLPPLENFQWDEDLNLYVYEEEQSYFDGDEWQLRFVLHLLTRKEYELLKEVFGGGKDK